MLRFACICPKRVSEHLLTVCSPLAKPMRPLLSMSPYLIRPYSLIVTFLFRSVYIFTVRCAGAEVITIRLRINDVVIVTFLMVIAADGFLYFLRMLLKLHETVKFS